MAVNKVPPKKRKIEEKENRRLQRILEGAEGQFTEGDLEGATEELGARGFTAKALVDFVNEAWERAAHNQGSTSGLDPDDSHEEAKNNSGALQGSGRASEGRSQGFHTEVLDLVKRFFQDRGDSCTVAEMGGLVNDALKMLEVDCRPRSMAGSRDIFHLPVQDHFAPGKPQEEFFTATLRGLNSLYGVSCRGSGEKPSPAARGVLKRLRAVIYESPLLKAEMLGLDFKTFFGTKGLDYSGEEVKLAQKGEMGQH